MFMKRVARAVNPTVDLAGDAAHEVLAAGAELLTFAPVPGLDIAAKVLLGIWDALQRIDMNYLACQRLTERCANILIAIHEEISRAGDTVADVMSEPLATLECAFQRILKMLTDQNKSSWIRRYLRRDEMLVEIAECNMLLQDCLGHFDVCMNPPMLYIFLNIVPQRSIQLRILKYVTGAPGTPVQPPVTLPDLDEVEIDIRTLPPSKDDICATIAQIQERQNERDRSRDMADFERVYSAPEHESNIFAELGVEPVDIPDAIKTLLRALEDLRSFQALDKLSTTIPFPRRSSTWPVDRRQFIELNLLDREIIEKGLREIKSSYKGPLPTLPSWTITRFEVDLGELIGRGFFSSVYKGEWSGRAVAIKVLEMHTSKSAFVNEVEVWKAFSHPHVLELYGASSAEGMLPWFTISPLMQHGSVTDYLKRIDWEAQRLKEAGNAVAAGTMLRDKVKFIRMMLDIAEGMKYVHEHGIYHGDLKAANVLVGEDLRCIVADFGQSKWKADVKQGNMLPNHALRWQAPELMSGHSLLTKKCDIYAFAMCCVEILTMGSIPWPTMTDHAVRIHVLDEQGRPPYPGHLADSLGLEEMLASAWHQSPSERPSFSKLVMSFADLKLKSLDSMSPRIAYPDIVVSPTEPSPHFQFSSPKSIISSDSPVSPALEYATPYHTIISNLSPDSTSPALEVGNESVDRSLRGSLLLFDDEANPPSSMNDVSTIKDLANIEDHFEFTYRNCLSHDFPRSLNVPLWTPCEASPGDVGYLTRGGQFIKLFNPTKPTVGPLRHVPAIAPVTIAHRQERTDKNPVWKRVKAFSRRLSQNGVPSPNLAVKRRYTFSLSGQRTAFLCAEKTTHHYIEDSRAWKHWFRANWDPILREFGPEHAIQKEDLILVIETLTAENYALFVNHGHLEQEAHFDTYAYPEGGPWGIFALPPEEVTDGVPTRLLHSKPDADEPTLLA
ncbi:hypothetical protein H0H81_010855 [Sphagnurus paluster]|uniref:Protein kinase domain-containing protein n=1 Tax=Sphagnurus paluster TaxID=117069 RepID=A0A9P7GHU2_9AGAR|nr:hypothetical protein H0H81_010855 [Sphagnurus paluster]